MLLEVSQFFDFYCRSFVIWKLRYERLLKIVSIVLLVEIYGVAIVTFFANDEVSPQAKPP